MSALRGQPKTDEHLRRSGAMEGGSALASHFFSLGAHATSSVHRPRLPPQDPRASLPAGRGDVGRPLNWRGLHTDPHSPSSLALLRSLPRPFFFLPPLLSLPASGRMFGPRFSGSNTHHPAFTTYVDRTACRTPMRICHAGFPSEYEPYSTSLGGRPNSGRGLPAPAFLDDTASGKSLSSTPSSTF